MGFVSITLPSPFVEGTWLRFAKAYSDEEGVDYREGLRFRYLGAKQNPVRNRLYVRGAWPSGNEFRVQTSLPHGLESLSGHLEPAEPGPEPVHLVSDRPRPSGPAPKVPAKMTSHEQARALIRELVARGEFQKAEKVVQSASEIRDQYGEGVISAAWDFEQEGNAADVREIALWYYGQSRKMYSLFASWSTGSGEGIERMRDVRRVEKMEAAFAQRWFPERNKK